MRTTEPTEIAVNQARRWGPEILKQRIAATANPAVATGTAAPLPPTPKQVLIVPAWGDTDVLLALTLTFDIGELTSQFWNEPRYDRAWHLSILAKTRDGRAQEVPAVDVNAWSLVYFMQHRKNTFVHFTEAPLFGWHIRLFTDRDGAPIVPPVRGPFGGLSAWPTE